MNNKKIVLYAHNGHNSLRGSWDEELVNYLLDHEYRDILHVRFPFGKDSLKSIRLFFYKNGKKEIRSSFINFSRPEIISYFKDFIYGFIYGFKYLKNTDLFVGTNNLLVLVGLCFKKIGFVKKVAYVMIDYTPIRFPNKSINALYYFLDKIACYHSDIVWPLSKKMLDGREHDNRIDLRRVNFREGPSGNDSFSFKEDDYRKYDKNKIVYFGGVLKSKGSELFIDIVKKLISKGFNDVILEIIGGGDVYWLNGQIKINGLEKNFHVYGRIENHEDIEKLLLTCSIAIAPYYPEDKNNFSYYADPGKVKFYLGCGLPIVITNVPPIAKDIENTNSGLIAEYDADDFADKILKIRQNYGFYRKNAVKFGKAFDWDNIFDNLLKDL